MAMVQYFEATDSSINSLPIKPGQLIYVKDTRKALFDSSDNTRIDLGDIVILDTETDRATLANPVPDKLYLVIASKQLYVYEKSAWVTATPDYTNTFVSKKGDTVDGDLAVTKTLTANKVKIGDATLEFDSTAKCLNFVFA